MVGKKTSRGRDFRKECWRYGVRLPFFFVLSWRHIVHRSMRTEKKEKKGVWISWVPKSAWKKRFCNVRYYNGL